MKTQNRQEKSKLKIERRHLWVVLAVLASGALLAVVMRPSALSVETAAVDRGPLQVTVDQDGETRVRERYVLAAPVTGRLVRTESEVGESVAAGQVLARVYPLALDTRTRTEAAAQLQAAEAGRRAAESAVAQAEALWGEARRALERLERVDAEARGAITPQRLDQARTAERSASLTVEQARRGAESAAHQVESARATLLGAESDTAEPTLLRAPVAGRVLRVYEESERAIAAGSPIIEIGDPSDLEVVVDVLSDDAARLWEGSPAFIATSDGEDSSMGHIRRIEPSAFTKVSPLGVEEQRVNVVVAFGDLPVLLGDRYRVDVSLVAWEASDVLRVPTSALFRSEGAWGVFVMENGRARLRHIELGQRGRREAEVLSGLAAGNEVVLYPSENVAEGVRVRAMGP